MENKKRLNVISNEDIKFELDNNINDWVLNDRNIYTNPKHNKVKEYFVYKERKYSCLHIFKIIVKKKKLTIPGVSFVTNECKTRLKSFGYKLGNIS